MGVQISHISYCLSEQKITNEQLSKDFPEYTSEQIFKRTGVRTRYNTSKGVIASDLAFNAAEKLFLESKFKKEDVEFLIFVTEGLDCVAPATAILLQNRLGFPTNIGAIDVPLGCSGFTHSLGLANTLISSEQVNNVLLLLGDTPSLGTHPDDFPLRSLFSDAGAAIWVEKSSKFGIGKFVYGTDGAGAKSLSVEGGLFRNPINKAWLEKYKDVGGMPSGRMQMNGIEVLSFSLQRVPKLVEDILSKNQLKFEDVDLFVFHQASQIILKSIQRKLKIHHEKMVYCFSENGNTVSVSIPLALRKLEEEGKLFKGAKVLIGGFGIGFSWSGTVIYY